MAWRGKSRTENFKIIHLHVLSVKVDFRCMHGRDERLVQCIVLEFHTEREEKGKERKKEPAPFISSIRL